MAEPYATQDQSQAAPNPDAYPVAKPGPQTVPDMCGTVYPGPHVSTPEETARAQELYDEFLPFAQNAYLSYFHTHTPPEFMTAMREIVAASAPSPPPELPLNQVVVTDQDSIPIVGQDGLPSGSGPGVATVVSGALQNVKLAV